MLVDFSLFIDLVIGTRLTIIVEKIGNVEALKIQNSGKIWIKHNSSRVNEDRYKKKNL